MTPRVKLRGNRRSFVREQSIEVCPLYFRDQENVNFQLKERLRLVQSWKCDLQQELNYNKKESACLEEKIRQLEHALKETYRPLQTALDCQKHRSVRDRSKSI